METSIWRWIKGKNSLHENAFCPLLLLTLLRDFCCNTDEEGVTCVIAEMRCVRMHTVPGPTHGPCGRSSKGLSPEGTDSADGRSWRRSHLQSRSINMVNLTSNPLVWDVDPMISFWKTPASSSTLPATWWGSPGSKERSSVHIYTNSPRHQMWEWRCFQMSPALESPLTFGSSWLRP